MKWLSVLLLLPILMGASARTQNFLASAPTPEWAERIAQDAEKWRAAHAERWLGKELPDWPRPCPIQANIGQMGASGATSFTFVDRQAGSFQMTVNGTGQRILDSVLPHEVLHSVFATHFNQALPRWADEGACTYAEAKLSRDQHQDMLVRFLQTGRGIQTSRLMMIQQYPADVMPLYSQGYSLTRFLIEQGGERVFVRFLENGLQDRDWKRAIGEMYGYESTLQLQESWLAWVKDGSPVQKPVDQIVAMALCSGGSCSGGGCSGGSCSPRSYSAPRFQGGGQIAPPPQISGPAPPQVLNPPAQQPAKPAEPQRPSVNLDELAELVASKLPKPQPTDLSAIQGKLDDLQKKLDGQAAPDLTGLQNAIADLKGKVAAVEKQGIWVQTYDENKKVFNPEVFVQLGQRLDLHPIPKKVKVAASK